MSPNPLAARPPAALQSTLPGLIDLRAGPAADSAAGRRIFELYQRDLSDETQRRHTADLAALARFLVTAQAVQLLPDQADQPDQIIAELGEQLATMPAAWAGMTWGIVQAYVEWLLGQGYAIGTVNLRLATARVYAGLAAQAGAIPMDAYAQIKLVKSIRGAQGRRIDQRRETTRVGAKKARANALSLEQFDRLLELAAASLRDLGIVVVLGENGLRVGELCDLTPTSFDIEKEDGRVLGGTLNFYRSKVDLQQRHHLSPEAAAAIAAYLATRDDLADDEPVFPQERTVNKILARLGRAIDIPNLSAHDLRHAWATWAAQAGTTLERLREGGGWASLAMPLHYINASAVANEGVTLRRKK